MAGNLLMSEVHGVKDTLVRHAGRMAFWSLQKTPLLSVAKELGADWSPADQVPKRLWKILQKVLGANLSCPVLERKRLLVR